MSQQQSDWSMSDHVLLAFFHGCFGILPLTTADKQNSSRDLTHKGAGGKESIASRSKQKERKSPRVIKNKRLQNGKSCLHCTWLKSYSRGSGMWWKVVGSSGRIHAPDPLTLNSLWRTALPPSSSSGSSPSLPATNRPRGSNVPQQHWQHSKEREKVVWLLFLQMMSHPDFVYWALLSMCVCACACTWVWVWRTYKLKE